MYRIGMFAAAAIVAALAVLPSTRDVHALPACRCSGALILPGMTPGEVLEKCGKPAWREFNSAPVRARGLYGTTHIAGLSSVEYWTYERAPGQFAVRLRFEAGRLETIRLLYRDRR